MKDAIDKLHAAHIEALQKLQEKLDVHAIDQLRDEVNRLAMRVEELERELYLAQQHAYDADRWQDMAMDLLNESSQKIGMTKNGEIGFIQEQK